MSLKVGVYGGSGYAGAELVRLLGGHPKVGGLEVASRGYAGRPIGEVFPQILADGAFVGPEEIEASGLDVAFVAYGHGESAETVAALLEAGVGLVVDLSADFRLPEVFGTAEGRLVANPGCYPTAAVLALAPVVRRIGEIRSIVINALSGVSGAGARPSVKTHFVSVNESANAYGAPLHRHTPEIETMLGRVGESPAVTFVPHLIPISRGELETIVVDLEEVPKTEEVLAWYAEDYENWMFVEARGEYPHVSHVANTNRCRLSAAAGRRGGELLLFPAGG